MQFFDVKNFLANVIVAFLFCKKNLYLCVLKSRFGRSRRNIYAALGKHYNVMSWIFCVQRASVVLENIFPHHAHRLGCGAEKRGLRCKLRKLLACYPKTFHIFALNKYL